MKAEFTIDRVSENGQISLIRVDNSKMSWLNMKLHWIYYLINKLETEWHDRL